VTDHAEMARLARQAAGYVEAGWTKHTLENDRGQVCALGALNKSFTGNAEHEPIGILRVNAYQHIKHLTVKELNRGWWRFGGSLRSLVSINDSLRSGKRIARAFRRVADKLDRYSAIPLKVTQRDMELAGGPVN
jgi:hypothetical protein